MSDAAIASLEATLRALEQRVARESDQGTLIIQRILDRMADSKEETEKHIGQIVTSVAEIKMITAALPEQFDKLVGRVSKLEQSWAQQEGASKNSNKLMLVLLKLAVIVATLIGAITARDRLLPPVDPERLTRAIEEVIGTLEVMP